MGRSLLRSQLKLMTLNFLKNQQRILRTMKSLTNQRLMMKLLCQKRIIIFGIATDILEAHVDGFVALTGGIPIAIMVNACVDGANVAGMGDVFGEVSWIFQKRLKFWLDW